MEKENKSNRGRKPKTPDYNSVFAQRFRNLIKEANITLPELAEKIGATRQSIGQWKDGNTIPNISALKRISEYFNVTSDYLLGLSEYQTAQAADIGNITGLPENAIEILKAISKNDAATKNVIMNFIDNLLDWQLLGYLAIRYEEYIENNENTDDFIISDNEGKPIEYLQVNEIKLTLLQKAFNDFLRFAVDKKNGNKTFSHSQMYKRAKEAE